MTEPAFVASRWSSPAMQARLRRRHRAERLFRALGLAAIGIALAALAAPAGERRREGLERLRGYAAAARRDARSGARVAARGSGRRPRASRPSRNADWATPLREALMRQFPDVTRAAAGAPAGGAALLRGAARARRSRGARSVAARAQRPALAPGRRRGRSRREGQRAARSARGRAPTLARAARLALAARSERPRASHVQHRRFSTPATLASPSRRASWARWWARS